MGRWRRPKRAGQRKSETPVVVVVVPERRRFLGALVTTVLTILSGMVPELVKQFWARPAPHATAMFTADGRSAATFVGDVRTPGTGHLSVTGSRSGVSASDWPIAGASTTNSTLR